MVFFGITVNFIIQKLKFCKIEKEDTLIVLLLAWDISRDSTAKKLSKDVCRRPWSDLNGFSIDYKMPQYITDIFSKWQFLS